MSRFSKEWNKTYIQRQRLTSWPWSDLISLFYRYYPIHTNNEKINILELGCGAGPNIPFFKSFNVNYHAIEGSKVIVDLLHEKFPEYSNQIIVGDFTDIHFYKNLNNMHVIVDRAALTHNNVFAIRDTLKYCYNALKEDGIFIGIDWFSTKHSDFSLGKEGDDKYTRTDIEKGDFQGLGNVHFSNEKHIRELF